MSLYHPTNLRCCTSSASASPIQRSTTAENGNAAILSFEGTKNRIKKMFNKVELSVSSYDTAWVAMIPSLNYSQKPFFPECLNWLMDNQLSDGSWGLSHLDPLFVKDAILSTLASVIALKRWNVGQEQINKGLYFVESNLASAIDDKQHSPIGFDIILPAMIEYAASLDLNFPIEPAKLDAMVHNRELKLKRAWERNSEGDKAYLAYISEGMGNLQDWEMAKKFQRKNGSLFNSPSATAAAFTNFKNDGCLKYLCSVLQKFGDAVPAVYPLDTYARLCMVDSLERLGIDRHFREEIKTVLDETYRCWLLEDENIFLDSATCAMAFRILRLNGYDVSSEPLTQFSEDHIFNYLGGHMKDISTILELFRASQLVIHPSESILEKQNFWTSHFLKQELSNGSIMADKLNKYIGQEVTEALKFPFYANLERLSSRKAMEHYNIDSTRILKTSYSSLNIRNEDFLKLAVEDFNTCQSIQQTELQILARWIVENKLDELNFARQKLAYCYFSAAATLFAPELYDARISWAKNAVLTTVVDDFFDVGGSEEELLNLIQLVEKWDVNVTVECCSENVKIIFLALHGAISDIAAQASMWQGRDVKYHIIEIWLDLLKSMLKEAEWLKNKSTPTMDEYMTNGYVSFALGPIVLPALYLVGPKLSEEVVRHSEFHNLYKLMSTGGRLLNDIHSFKRESEEGKLNAVSLAMIQSNGNATQEECIKEMKSVISSKRRELLRLVLQEKGCVVPRACKDLFWKMSKVLHLFYAKDDGFTSHEMANAVNAVIRDPLLLAKS